MDELQRHAVGTDAVLALRRTVESEAASGLAATAAVERAVTAGMLESRAQQAKVMAWLRELAAMSATQRDSLAALRSPLEQQTQRLDEALAAVRRAAAFSEGRDQKLLDWIQAVAAGHDQDRKVLANLTQSLSETRSGVLEAGARTQKIVDWQAALGQAVGDISGKGLAALSAEIAAMGDSVGDDALARARLMNGLNRRYETLAGETLTSLRRLTGETAPQPDGDTPPADRAFGLSGASPDPELEGLLALGRFLHDEPAAAGAVSSITGAALRRLFPAGMAQHQTIEARSGLKLKVDASDIYAAGIVFGRIQEADDFAIFMAMVEPGARVVDVGANFGLYASHAALYAGQTGKVFAFEPAPDTYELLSLNLKANGLDTICQASDAIVAAAPGEATFYVAADSAFSGLSDTGRSPLAHTLPRAVVSLDTFAPLQSEAAIDLLKIDVEGFEGGVLAGARALIARSPDLLIMLEFCYKNLTEERRAAVVGELQALEALGLAVYLLQAGDTGLKFSEIKAGDLPQNLNQNLFVCAPGGATDARLHAAAAARALPTANAEEAAALALLKRVVTKP